MLPPVPSDEREAVANGLVGDEARQFRVAQWRMLLATMFCYLFFYTGRQTFGFAIPGIQEELGFSKANKSQVIRFALDQVAIQAMPRVY